MATTPPQSPALGNIRRSFDVTAIKCGKAIDIPNGKLLAATTTTGDQLLELQYEANGQNGVVHFSRALIRQLDDAGKIGLTSPTITCYTPPAVNLAVLTTDTAPYTIDLTQYKPQTKPLADSNVLSGEWSLTFTSPRAVYDLKVLGDATASWTLRLIREYNFIDPPMYARSWIVDESKLAATADAEEADELMEGEIRQGNYALPKVAPFAIALPAEMKAGQEAGFKWWCLMTADSPLIKMPPVPKERPAKDTDEGADTAAEADTSA